MRAILYTHDMEPITALTLEGWMAECIAKRGGVNLPVLEPLPFLGAIPPVTMPTGFRRVRITAEWFTRRGQRHLMLFTDDEESALLLRSVFLPGQRSALREAEDAAMARGITRAFKGLDDMLRGFHE